MQNKTCKLMLALHYQSIWLQAGSWLQMKSTSMLSKLSIQLC